ncbi:ABC transporter transmembrane domain-containing protein [Glycomyces algeriensis]|uniref:ABC transporter transmembrane domain-containing protein n=1 Tax=Glycomyces algeriensis TaxID=256037 RepID=UPI0022DB2922|nr:ABC transporter ATP-binding protein [Glycomyces algeriensis]MDA1366952.1 ABC transporter ATP-binding protein [Glycomyces algeriensis]MDR7352662.1 ABC-type multidrug transport system fused ATPase/permease subunit [Glycomyces algeriensis]
MSPADIPADPWRYLWYVARAQTGLVALGFVLLSISGAAWILLPWTIAKIIDEVLLAESAEPLARWSIMLVVVAIASSWVFVAGYRSLFMAESHARVRTVRNITDHLNRAGTGVRGAISPGEMVNLSTEDAHKTGSFIFQLGFGWMGLVMTAVGAVLLWRASPALGITTLSGVLLIGFVVGPVLGRLQHHQIAYRSSVATLTGQASDVVGGLRVLRGVGGEEQFSRRYRAASAELRDAGYGVATADSWVQGLKASLPLALIAAVTWVGARLALHGTITIGELSAAFGMTALVAQHSGAMIGMAQAVIAAQVASRRLTAFFNTRSDIADDGTATGAAGTLRDPESGLEIEPGRLTVIVSAEAKPAEAAMERLARYREAGPEPGTEAELRAATERSSGADRGAATAWGSAAARVSGAERSSGADRGAATAWGSAAARVSSAEWGDVKLADLTLDEVRERVLLLRDDYLFAQTLGETLRVDEERALAAISAAGAGDVHSSLGSSMDGEVHNAGRNLSGGQRQRLRLARALAADAEVLLAVEPTSAVDAHTESLIAERVAAARAGRTTAVVTASPLWLARADAVAWLVDGKVRATGSHAELSLQDEYRSLTSRQES